VGREKYRKGGSMISKNLKTRSTKVAGALLHNRQGMPVQVVGILVKNRPPPYPKFPREEEKKNTKRCEEVAERTASKKGVEAMPP